ncbi:hypothetical protein RJT34_32480 [Clitoria ternatea]|uniref:Uncharacterized protein n=1 Tax=Clitoria ternatea TaxID=43366 RepID=A0AAN9EWI1_CLITE
MESSGMDINLDLTHWLHRHHAFISKQRASRSIITPFPSTSANASSLGNLASLLTHGKSNTKQRMRNSFNSKKMERNKDYINKSAWLNSGMQI